MRFETDLEQNKKWYLNDLNKKYNLEKSKTL